MFARLGGFRAALEVERSVATAARLLDDISTMPAGTAQNRAFHTILEPINNTATVNSWPHAGKLFQEFTAVRHLQDAARSISGDGMGVNSLMARLNEAAETVRGIRQLQSGAQFVAAGEGVATRSVSETLASARKAIDELGAIMPEYRAAVQHEQNLLTAMKVGGGASAVGAAGLVGYVVMN